MWDMEKTVILPEWRSVDSEALEEPVSSYGTVVDHGDYRRVVFSGGTWPEGDVAEQVRQVLAHRRNALEDLGGSMDDVVSMQFFVLGAVLSRETQARIHEVRDEFFTRPHYPASTMVGVDSLVVADALVEVELEAEIPEDDWDVTVVTGDE